MGYHHTPPGATHGELSVVPPTHTMYRAHLRQATVAAAASHGSAHRSMGSMIPDSDDEDDAFVAQILKVIKVGGNQGIVRYRVILSDGLNFVQGMLHTPLNHLVTGGQIVENAIIRIEDYMSNMVQNRFVMIVLAVVVIDSQYGRKIGNPSYIEDGPSAKVEAGGDAADGTQYTQPLPLRQAKRQRTECCVHPGLVRELPDDVVVSIWKLVGGGPDSLALLKDDHDRAHVAKALVGKFRLLLLSEYPEMESVVQNLQGSKEELDLYCIRLHQLANTGLSVGAIAAIRSS